MRYMTPKRQREWEWERIRDHFHGLCAYCGIKPALLVREHMVPRVRGGEDEFENIVPACGPCNTRKGSKTPLEWFLSRDRACWCCRVCGCPYATEAENWDGSVNRTCKGCGQRWGYKYEPDEHFVERLRRERAAVARTVRV